MEHPTTNQMSSLRSLLVLWFCIALCLTYIGNGSLGTNKILGTNPTLQIKQSVTTGRFIGKRILYYSNSCVTFRYRILCSGDVSPNPGPARSPSIDTTGNRLSSDSTLIPDNGSKITYDRKELLRLNNYRQLSVSRDVWSTIKSLDICSRKFTRRGTSAGVCARNSISATTNANLSSLQETSKLMNISLWNAQSIRNKVAVLHDCILENDTDIFFITETWLSDKDEVVLGELSLPGYKVFSVPRTPGIRQGGGGLVWYLKTSLIWRLERTVYLRQPPLNMLFSLIALTMLIMCLFTDSMHILPANSLLNLRSLPLQLISSQEDQFF